MTVAHSVFKKPAHCIRYYESPFGSSEDGGRGAGSERRRRMRSGTGEPHPPRRSSSPSSPTPFPSALSPPTTSGCRYNLFVWISEAHSIPHLETTCFSLMMSCLD